MKKGIARPEINNGKKLVAFVRTRSPLEAYQLLRAGQPIDQTIGWYQQQTNEVQDVSMMDTLAKLHYLSDLRDRVAIQRSDVEQMTQEVNQFQSSLIKQHEQTNAAAAQQEQDN